MAQPLTLDPLLPSHTVHQFPLPTFIENLAIRSNGQLLLTVLSTGSLILLDPTKPSSPTLIHKFDGLAVTGIIELEHDVFYVAVGKIDLVEFKTEFGNFAIWKVDMQGFEKDGEAKIEKIADLPNSKLPNGFEAFPNEKSFFLFADSEVGAVFKVDVNTGASEILIQVDEMKHTSEGLPIGINGIKYRDGYLYWSNTNKQLFCRIKVDAHGKAAGEPEVIAKDLVVDDFVFDKKGNAWVTTHVLNTIAVVKTDGAVVTVAGKLNEFTVAGGSACQFGRGEGDRYVLYVTTNGGLSAPVGGDKVEGGKVVAIDTSTFEGA